MWVSDDRRYGFVVRERQDVSLIVWADRPGRTADLARALGGVQRGIYPFPQRWLAPVRYAFSLVSTVSTVLRDRPRAVIAQNPPVFPGLVSWLWSKGTGSRFILDSHPTAFGAKDNRQGRAMLKVSGWLAKRADGVLVTTEGYARQVRGWGGRPLVLHEAAPPSGKWSAVVDIEPMTVLFTCTFDQDDPVSEVFDAARLLPDVTFYTTGDPNRMEVRDRANVPKNVELVGWIDLADFHALMSRSAVVLALTTEETSVMRSAFEAVFAARPLVTSDVGDVSELFPAAVLVENRAGAIAAGISQALSGFPGHEAIEEQRAAAIDRWHDQEACLRDMAGLPHLPTMKMEDPE